MPPINIYGGGRSFGIFRRARVLLNMAGIVPKSPQLVADSNELWRIIDLGRCASYWL